MQSGGRTVEKIDSPLDQVNSVSRGRAARRPRASTADFAACASRLMTCRLGKPQKHDPLIWLAGTLHPILKLAIAFWQFSCDDVCPSWNV